MKVSARKLNDVQKISDKTFDGKLVSIQMLVNNLKKLYSVRKSKQQRLIHPWFLTILMCNVIMCNNTNVTILNNWELLKTSN